MAAVELKRVSLPQMVSESPLSAEPEAKRSPLQQVALPQSVSSVSPLPRAKELAPEPAPAPRVVLKAAPPRDEPQAEPVRQAPPKAPAAHPDKSITTSLMEQIGSYPGESPVSPGGIDIGEMGEQNVASDQGVAQAVASAGTGDVARGAPLIGAPPLQPPLVLPQMLRAPSSTDGIIGLFSYGIVASREVSKQNDLIQVMGTQLAKLKRQEKDLISALGRAARGHHLAPHSCKELVEACTHQEQNTEKDRLRASEKEMEASIVEMDYVSSRAEGESKLVGLESQQVALSTKLSEAKAALAEEEAKVAELQKKETALKKPSIRGVSEEQAAERVREYEATQAMRKISEMEVETLREQVWAAERPVGRIKTEISVVNEKLKGAEDRLSTAENQAAAAVISGERRHVKAERTVAELDEEIGRTILGSPARSPSFRQLIKSVDSAARYVDIWDEALRVQQAELDQIDVKRARKGFWLLMGLVLGGFSLLFVGGEALRRAVMS